MENAIVKINPTEYGLTDETAARIEAQFTPMLAKMTELEGEYNAILGLNIEDPNTAKLAKDLRLKYVKVRTGTADIHKVQKAYFLNGGRFVDGWKNAQLFASQGKEEALERIEKHAENLERERLEKLQQLRVALLAEYVENASELSLSGMEQDVFDAYLSAKKQAFEDRKAAELKAEQDRIAREKAEAEEREAQRLENIRLKEEADKREAEIEKERLAAQKERERVERENADRLAAERKAAAELAAKIKADNDARIAAEKAERARIEKENAAQLAKLQAEKDAEIAKRDRIIEEFKLNSPVIDAAARYKAVNPEQVKALIRSNLRLNPEGEVEVLDEKGVVKYDDQGRPVSVDNFVQTWLQQNPHFVQPTPSTSATKGNVGFTQNKMDLSKLDMSNPEHRKIYAESRKAR